MKKLIWISFFLNVGLVAGVAYFAKQKPRVEVGKTVEADFSKKDQNKSKRPPKTQTQVVKVPEDRFSWREVESEDYKQYVANLRAILCPEETVRDIIIADVNKFYAAKLKPLRKPVEPWKYWSNDQNWGGRRESEEFYSAQREIEKEKRELLKELLGSDYQEEIAKQYGYSDRNKDPFMESLPKETKELLAEIQRKFGEQQNEVYRKAKGYHDEDTQNDLRKIEKARRDEMAKILSPEDLFEWEVRNSQAAQNMKWNELAGFDASEEEFRAIFKMKIAADEARSTASPEEEKAEREARHKLENQIQDELKSALGEDRYKEYQRAQDWEYKQIASIADRQGIAKESVVKVYEMKADVQQAARQVNADKSLTMEQRREKLLEIKQLAEQEATGALGERGFKQWKRNAWWLRNIVPPEKEVPKEWVAPK